MDSVLAWAYPEPDGGEAGKGQAYSRSWDVNEKYKEGKYSKVIGLAPCQTTRGWEKL